MRVPCAACGETFRPRKDGKLRAHRRRVAGPRGGTRTQERRYQNADYCPGGPLPAWKE
jgi:hypothetical protein